MELHQVGGTGVSLSSIGLGGVELGPEDGEEPDVARARRVIDTAREAGINWLDTSENYHGTRNESLIGEALNQGIVISTKVAPVVSDDEGGSGFLHDQVNSACRASLRRLRVDVIDVYLLHWPDETGVPLEETWGAMAELADQGLVRAIGLSNYEMPAIESCHAQRTVDVVQTGLSMIDYLQDRGLIARCGELGIPIAIYEPLAGGALTGKTLEEIRSVWATWTDFPFYQRLFGPGTGERSIAVANGIRPIAERLSATMAQVAIAWVLAQPGVTVALAGSRDGRHVAENAQAARLDLKDVMDELDALIPLGPLF